MAAVGPPGERWGRQGSGIKPFLFTSQSAQALSPSSSSRVGNSLLSQTLGVKTSLLLEIGYAPIGPSFLLVAVLEAAVEVLGVAQRVRAGDTNKEGGPSSRVLQRVGPNPANRPYHGC